MKKLIIAAICVMALMTMVVAISLSASVVVSPSALAQYGCDGDVLHAPVFGGVEYPVLSPDYGRGLYAGLNVQADSCVSSISYTSDLGSGSLVRQGTSPYFMAQFFVSDAATPGGHDIVITPSPGGNPVTVTFTVTVMVDVTPPMLSIVYPTGNDTVTTTDTTIIIAYDDPPFSEGMIYGVMNVFVDGSPLSGCYRDSGGLSGNINCTVTGLVNGEYTITGSISDNAGNSSSINGSFTVCIEPPPVISMQVADVLWESYDDYLARRLTVQLMLENTGPDAYGTEIKSIVCTKGVVPLDSFPLAVGNIASGESRLILTAYLVPPGISRFRISVGADSLNVCGACFNYP